MSEQYLGASADLTKICLRFFQKIKWIILTVAAGMAMGILLYFGYHFLTDGVEYQASAKIYLDFATDETGEVYQYYNGYTWNDLMSTSPIIDETMNCLGNSEIARDEAETSVKAEILSDIRLLTITVTNADEVHCNQILTAVQNSLEKLGDTAKEFTDIRVIKTVSAKRIYADNRLPQAILLGAILGLLFGLLGFVFISILDDIILVPSDLSGSLSMPVLGVSLVGESKLQAKLEHDKNAALQAVLGDQTPLYIHADELTGTDISKLQYESWKGQMILLLIPYGKVHRSRLLQSCALLQTMNCDIRGCIITDADSGFYRRYYRWNAKEISQ